MTVTRAIQVYLHSNDFRDAVADSYRRYEILSEEGLRTAVANFLDAKVKALGAQAEGYRVTCEVHLKKTKVIPDILLWKGGRPRIWIELKFTRIFDPKKARDDWQKLQTQQREYKSVKAGFLIYVSRSPGGATGIKGSNATRRFRAIEISLSDQINGFKKWYDEYRRRAHYDPEAQSRRSKRTGS